LRLIRVAHILIGQAASVDHHGWWVHSLSEVPLHEGGDCEVLQFLLDSEDTFASALAHQLFCVGRGADQVIHSIALLVTQVVIVRNPTQTRAHS